VVVVAVVGERVIHLQLLAVSESVCARVGQNVLREESCEL
jgi:hypothetical protein